MTHYKTCLSTMEFVSQVLTDYFDNNHVEASQYPKQYQSIIQVQNQIGWIHIFMGRFTVAWDKLANNDNWVAALASVLRDNRTKPSI